jgi:D-alanyl-D-alanine carboxypeptidase
MRQALAMLLLVSISACVSNNTQSDQAAPQPSSVSKVQPLLAVTTNPTATPAVDGIISPTAAAGQFSGAALVARNDQVVFLKAYGLADRAANLPNHTDTQFNIGSVTKMFTAVAILQLVQRGQATLTAPISTYLPSYPRDIADQITVEQLLLHISGLGDYITKPAYWAGAKDHLQSLEDYPQLFEQDPLAFPPGTSWKYSNAGYVLLGLIIEHVSGQHYWTYIQEHVFAPAGMARTDANERDNAVPNRAINYTRLDDRLQVGSGAAQPNTRWLPSRAGPDGGSRHPARARGGVGPGRSR